MYEHNDIFTSDEFKVIDRMLLKINITITDLTISNQSIKNWPSFVAYLCHKKENRNRLLIQEALNKSYNSKK